MIAQLSPPDLHWLVTNLETCVSNNFETLPFPKKTPFDFARSFNSKDLARFALVNDLFFVIRQAVGVDNSKTTQRLKYASPCIRFLAQTMATLRPAYKEFANGPDEKVAGAVTYWIKDEEIFGSLNAATKFFAQNACAHFALELNFPILFTSYKDMVLWMYKSIVEAGGFTGLEQGKLVEMDQRLNRVWVKEFFKKMTTDFSSLDITLEGSIYEHLKITGVNFDPFLQSKVYSLFESRTSSLESLAGNPNETLKTSWQADQVPAWSVNIEAPVVFDEVEFKHVVQTSRRQSGCSHCSEKGNLTCKKCAGEGENDCSFCKGGFLTCTVCNGSCRESFVEYQQNITTCSCKGQGCSQCNGVGFIHQNVPKNSLRPCTHCSAKGRIQCTHCFGKLRVPCSGCFSKGKVECDKCKGTKKLEHRQVVHVKLLPKTRNFSLKSQKIPDNIISNSSGAFFTTIASVTGKSLSKLTKNISFERNVPQEFLDLIVQYLETESFPPSGEFKLNVQELVCKITYCYQIDYEYRGLVSRAWWHPKGNIILENEIGRLVIPAIIQSAQVDWKKRDYSKATERLLFAENLAGANKCTDFFQKQYRKLPFPLKFAKWLKKQFTVQVKN